MIAAFHALSDAVSQARKRSIATSGSIPDAQSNCAGILEYTFTVADSFTISNQDADFMIDQIGSTDFTVSHSGPLDFLVSIIKALRKI